MARRRGRGWHPEDIKAELRKRFGTLTALAERLGYHRSSVGRALGRPDYPGIHQAVAAALGVTPHTLWPQWWSPDGVYLGRSSIARDHSRPGDFPHRQKLEAA